MKPLAIDLACGLGGWTEGLLAEGWDVIGFDIERHVYGEHGQIRYPAQLVLQDILTLDGRQFRGKVSLIVASPPCQEYSYMAMPWSRAKKIAEEYRSGARDRSKLTALFDACLRIGREAECPVVIENVRGAQPWVGRAKANYGSFYLWGDVPVLMPKAFKAVKVPMPPGGDSLAIGFQQQAKLALAAEHRQISPGWRAKHYDKTEKAGLKHGGDWFSDPASPGRQGGVTRARALADGGVKQPGLSGKAWFDHGASQHASKSSARKAASARIAKIPLRLARWVARYYYPESLERSA